MQNSVELDNKIKGVVRYPDVERSDWFGKRPLGNGRYHVRDGFTGDPQGVIEKLHEVFNTPGSYIESFSIEIKAMQLHKEGKWFGCIIEYFIDLEQKEIPEQWKQIKHQAQSIMEM